MTTDGSDSLRLPVIAFRGLWDRFAGPRSLGALRRSYQRGVPSLVRCGYEGVDLADAIDIVNDPATNARRLPLYLVTPDGPEALFGSPRKLFWADIFAVTMSGGIGDTGSIARWDGTGWPRVGCYVTSSATRRGLTADDIQGATSDPLLAIFESANVIDDVVLAVQAPAPSDDSVLASLRRLAGPDAQIFRVSDLVELDLLARQISDVA